MNRESTSEIRHPRIVGDVMTRDVVTIPPDESIHRAIQLMADSHVSGLAVVDSHNKLIGVVSSTDVLSLEAEASEDRQAPISETTTVDDVMTQVPLTVSPELPLREAALHMEYGQVHRLFVVQDDQLMGVISLSDINRALAVGR